ncbi:MAG UNVERIFIED_CONTAM: hypothetical protein LVR29_20930 [Microcystis novacekii LVE1205-3]|jgi:hypothetical protein
MESRKNFSQRQEGQIGKTRIIGVSAAILILVSLLSLLLVQPSLASPDPPNSVIDAARQDLSRKTKILVNRLQIQQHNHKLGPMVV